MNPLETHLALCMMVPSRFIFYLKIHLVVMSFLLSCSITCFLSCFLEAFLLMKHISSSYIAGIQTWLIGPNNTSSNVVSTPGSVVIAEYTSHGVSWVVLIDSASVGVIPNALSSLAILGLCGFDSSFSISSSSYDLSSSCISLSFFSSSSFSLSSLFSSSSLWAS
jgi:hypothetical protein